MEPRPTPPRSGRFGSLRDFVLTEVPGGTLFVDRFEVTRGDWREFAAAGDGRAVDAERAQMHGDPSLPVGGVDVAMARAFAAWRFARLPRLDEWRQAVYRNGAYQFPWGVKADATSANTAELGIGEPTLCGTFESGRRGNGPYDLIGNVSEWTETVPNAWFAPTVSDSKVSPEVLWSPAVAAQTSALQATAGAVWQVLPGVVPPLALIGAGGATTPRAVVGADFQSSMLTAAGLDAAGESVPAGERRGRTGLRLFTTPRELLQALSAYSGEPSADDLLQMERFVARDRHREVLLAAGVALRGAPQAPVARWLVAQGIVQP